MGHHQTEIVKFMEVDKSTISREFKRNQSQRGCRPKQAHNLAMRRQSPQGMELGIDLRLVAEKIPYPGQS
jgi:IS30 family transposase